MNEAMPSESRSSRSETFLMTVELWMAEMSVAVWSSVSSMPARESLVRLVAPSACESVPSSCLSTASVSVRVGDRPASTLLRLPEASENESSAA